MSQIKLSVERFEKALGKKRMAKLDCIEIEYGADTVITAVATYPLVNDTTIRCNCVEETDTFQILVHDFKCWIDLLTPDPDNDNWIGYVGED